MYFLWASHLGLIMTLAILLGLFMTLTCLSTYGREILLPCDLLLSSGLCRSCAVISAGIIIVGTIISSGARCPGIAL